MGLDMYLGVRKYIEKTDWSKLDNDSDLTLESPEIVFPEFNNVIEASGLSDFATANYGAHISVICIYWRKANQIHKWFVDNVQGGEDNCGEYYVSNEKLKSLLDLVTEALRTRDPNLLPPTSGFFFGSTDIDEWYWKDLKDTKWKLERVLALSEMSKLSFYYTSSW